MNHLAHRHRRPLALSSASGSGASHSVTQISLVTQLGLGFKVLETRALRIDAEARYVLAKGADIAFTTLGLAACFDVIQLGP